MSVTREMHSYRYAVGHDRGHPPPDSEYVRSVHGFGPADAAEDAAERSDREDVSYHLEQDIWLKDETGAVYCVTVTMESVPAYTARLVDGGGQDAHAPREEYAHG